MKKRAGGTTRLSISLPTAEAKILKRRAKRVHGGNASLVHVGARIQAKARAREPYSPIARPRGRGRVPR